MRIEMLAALEEPTTQTEAEEVERADDVLDAPPRAGRAKLALGGALALAAGVGALWQFGLLPGTTAAHGASGEAQAAVARFAEKGPADLRGVAQALDVAGAAVGRFDVPAEATQVPADRLAGNPFVHAGRRAKTKVPVADAPQGTPQSQAEFDRLGAEAARFRLGSVLVGSARRHCLIDNKLYRVGQTVEADGAASAFVVDAIEPTGVTLASGPHRFQLRVSR